MPLIIENLDVQIQDAPPVPPPSATAGDGGHGVLVAIARDALAADRHERLVVE